MKSLAMIPKFATSKLHLDYYLAFFKKHKKFNRLARNRCKCSYDLTPDSSLEVKATYAFISAASATKSATNSTIKFISKISTKFKRSSNANKQFFLINLTVLLYLSLFISFVAGSKSFHLAPVSFIDQNVRPSGGASRLEQATNLRNNNDNNDAKQLANKSQYSKPVLESQLYEYQASNSLQTTSNRPLITQIEAKEDHLLRSPCLGCRLAIPLVSFIGNRQLNGYLIPNEQIDQIQTKQHQQKHPITTTNTNKQQSANKPQEPQASGHFAPSNGRKCPMTGPMTVCDQIDSYPADVIVHKVVAAKRDLEKSTNFNIDSLFIDEREHLSEPFSDDSWSNHKMPLTLALQSTKSKPNGEYKISNASSASFSSSDRINSNASLNTKADDHSQVKKFPYQASDSNYLIEDGLKSIHDANHQKRGTKKPDLPESISSLPPLSILSPLSSQPYQLSQSSQPSQHSKPPPPPPLPSNSDDFLNLVERRAISISRPKSELKDQDKHQMARYQTSNELPEPISNRSVSAAVERLLLVRSKGRILDNVHKEDLSMTSSSVRQTSKWFRPEPMSTVLRPRKRFRRQVSVRVESGSSSGNQQSASISQRKPEREEAIEANTNSNLASGDQNSRIESLCRARSIYISPKAAMNDKKQWKYVVNAPEKDPRIRQIIRVDLCEDPFGSCTDQISVPFGYTSQCKQKYSKKKLLALDSINGLLEVDTFFIPSCCVCQLVLDSQA